MPYNSACVSSLTLSVPSPDKGGGGLSRVNQKQLLYSIKTEVRLHTSYPPQTPLVRLHQVFVVAVTFMPDSQAS